MPIEVTYEDALVQLAELSDLACRGRETIIIHRKGAEDVALVSAVELKGCSRRRTSFVLPKMLGAC
jgi:hypothetical protein